MADETQPGSWEILRNAILGVIAEAQNIGRSATGVKQAFKTERSKFDGYPAAVIKPTNQSADYAETKNDSSKETYIFRIYIHHPIKEDDDKSQEIAELKIEKAIDELIGLFRSRDVLGRDKADWVRPIPSEWAYTNFTNGWCRTGILTLECVKYVK
jgi:hypothetical protein